MNSTCRCWRRTARGKSCRPPRSTSPPFRRTSRGSSVNRRSGNRTRSSINRRRAASISRDRTSRCWITVSDLARELLEAVRLSGYARVDFRVDGDGQPWILEVNANPCLSPDAGFAAAVSRPASAYDDAVQTDHRRRDTAARRAGSTASPRADRPAASCSTRTALVIEDVNMFRIRRIYDDVLPVNQTALREVRQIFDEPVSRRAGGRHRTSGRSAPQPVQETVSHDSLRRRELAAPRDRIRDRAARAGDRVLLSRLSRRRQECAGTWHRCGVVRICPRRSGGLARARASSSSACRTTKIVAPIRSYAN